MVSFSGDTFLKTTGSPSSAANHDSASYTQTHSSCACMHRPAQNKNMLCSVQANSSCHVIRCVMTTWPHNLIRGHGSRPREELWRRWWIGMFYFKWCYIRGGDSTVWVSVSPPGWHDSLSSVRTTKGKITSSTALENIDNFYLQRKDRWTPGNMAVSLCGLYARRLQALVKKKIQIIVGFLFRPMTYLTIDSWLQIMVSRMGFNVCSGI